MKTKIYYKFLERIENECKKDKLDMDFDIDDIYFAAREISEWRCAATGKRVPGLSLKIWDTSKPINGKNMLLFGSKYAKEKTVGGMKNYQFGQEESERINELLKKAEQEYKPNMSFSTNMENND